VDRSLQSFFDEDGTKKWHARIYGSVTGRQRRCWLDLALKYAIQVKWSNAIDDDERRCTSGFETLKVCTDYNYKGKNIAHFLYNIVFRKCNNRFQRIQR
jgi:adenylosuccinate synthase